MTKRAKPKSESLACPWSSSRMFSHLRSLCAMLWLCRYWTARTTPWKIERVSFSGSDPRLRMYSSRSPRFACSMITHVYAPIRTICSSHRHFMYCAPTLVTLQGTTTFLPSVYYGGRTATKYLLLCLTRKRCYRKDDRAMRPIYRLFHPNFVHAYRPTSITLRGFDSEWI